MKIVDVPLTRMASATARLKRNSAVGLLDGLEDLLLIGYIDGSNSKTRSLKNSVTRIGKSDIKDEGNDNYAYSITKTEPAVKSTGKVTNV